MTRAPVPAFAFDLDGTLADCSHRLHHITRAPGDLRPKDWRSLFASVDEDAPVAPMVTIAKLLCLHGRRIVIITSRSDECREATRAWVDLFVWPGLPIYMRRAGDHRDDDIVKPELFAEARRDGFEIVQAFEDRARVVRALRAAGYAVAQVAEGEF